MCIQYTRSREFIICNPAAKERESRQSRDGKGKKKGRRSAGKGKKERQRRKAEEREGKQNMELW